MNKIRAAITALDADFTDIIDDTRILQTITDLDLLVEENEIPGEVVLDAVRILLGEILQIGGSECFRGLGPQGNVDYCQKKGFRDTLLYVYAWFSPLYEKELYLKFGLKKEGGTTLFKYCHLSCHEDENKS